MNFFLLKSALLFGKSSAEEIPAAVAFVLFGIGANIPITIPGNGATVPGGPSLASALAKADAAAGECRRRKYDFDERLYCC